MNTKRETVTYEGKIIEFIKPNRLKGIIFILLLTVMIYIYTCGLCGLSCIVNEDGRVLNENGRSCDCGMICNWIDDALKILFDSMIGGLLRILVALLFIGTVWSFYFFRPDVYFLVIPLNILYIYLISCLLSTSITKIRNKIKKRPFRV